MTPLSPDFLLGYRLATASSFEFHQALALRPDDLARLTRVKTLVEQVIPVVDRHLQPPNEIALARIVPPPTIRSQRRIARVRLRMMQAELNFSTLKILLAFVILLASAPSVLAEGPHSNLPDAPAPAETHTPRYAPEPASIRTHMQIADWTVFGLDAFARGLDAYSTEKALHNGDVETMQPNWIAHHAPVEIAYSAAVVAGNFEMMRFFERHHHKWIGRTWMLADSIYDGRLAIKNLGLAPGWANYVPPTNNPICGSPAAGMVCQ